MLRAVREFGARVPPGRRLTLRASPEGRVLTTVGPRTEFGSPQTFSVAYVKGPWLAVRSSALGNTSLGWVRARRVSLLNRTLSLEVDLSKRELVVHDVGVLRRIRVAVGAPDTPTPRALLRHGQAPGRRVRLVLRLLHPRALGPATEPSGGLVGRRPARDPRLPHADLGPRRLERLPARGGARPSLPDEDRSARDRGADPRVDSADGRRRPRRAARPPRRIGRLVHALESAHEQGIALPVKDYWEFDRLVTVSDPQGVQVSTRSTRSTASPS